MLIKTVKGQYKGRYCVMAMPPTLSLKMKYSPLLPPAKEQLAQNMPMGAVLKVHIDFMFTVVHCEFTAIFYDTCQTWSDVSD